MQTVLVIESDPANLLALALILRSFGYTVLEADSPDEAVGTCQEYPGPIHLVVTEAVLGNENASELVARLQSLCPQIRVLLISNESADGLAETNTYGCKYLKKPFRVDALADSIRTLLDGPKRRAASVNGTHRIAVPRKIWDKTMTSRLLQSWMPIHSVSDIAFGQPPAPMRAALKWSSVTIAMAAVVLILLLSTRRPSVPALTRIGPAQSFSLTLTGEGDRLRLSWNGAAPAIQHGRCGVLWIADGSIQRRIILDVSQMRAGSLSYSPNTNDVSVRLNMCETNDSLVGPDAINNSISVVQPAKGPVRPMQQAETANLRNGHNTAYMARRQGIRFRQPERVSYNANPVSSGSRPALVSPRERPESPPFATSPVQSVVEKQILVAATSPVSKSSPEPFSTVTIETNTESHARGLMGKIPPLLRRLHPRPEFEPPTPVHESTPVVDDHLRRSLKSEVPLDVRVYINRSGKVDYAELLSDITGGNRDLATLAVFDARHWEFTPARLGTRIVPGRAILHYRFGNPVLAISRDQE
jgi:CheY-like chemotaxis protein